MLILIQNKYTLLDELAVNTLKIQLKKKEKRNNNHSLRAAVKALQIQALHPLTMYRSTAFGSH